MDILTREQRSALMGRIRGRDTGPELSVRRVLSALGYRYRLHRATLPGRPDIVFKSRQAVIFIHGCFWHRHHCGLAYSPKTRRQFWERKFKGNVARDRAVQRALRAAGWRVLIVWECQINRPAVLAKRLVRFLGPL
jgi:DNA mismatch endonuclease (patch repair protein)